MQVRGRRVMPADLPSALHAGFTGAASSPWRSATAPVPRAAGAASGAFVGVCTPSLCAADVLSTSLLVDGGASTVAWDTSVFRSQHQLDMKFIDVDHKSASPPLAS